MIAKIVMTLLALTMLLTGGILLAALAYTMSEERMEPPRILSMGWAAGFLMGTGLWWFATAVQ